MTTRELIAKLHDVQVGLTKMPPALAAFLPSGLPKPDEVITFLNHVEAALQRLAVYEERDAG